MQQIEHRLPTEEAHVLSQEILTLIDQKDADVQTAHEAMIWTIITSAGRSAGALTFPPNAKEEIAEIRRILLFFTSLRLLTANVIAQL